MAKKHTTESTPIEFHIPAASLGGKGPRVPVPINQPNWKYKYGGDMKSKPGYSIWAAIGISFAFITAFAALIITVSMHKSPLWVVVAALVIIAVLQIRSAAIKTANHKQELEDEEIHNSKKKRKKKISKHRKDYK